MKSFIAISIALLTPIYLFCQHVQSPGDNNSYVITKNQFLNFQSPVQDMQKNSNRGAFVKPVSGIAEILKSQNSSTYLLDSFVYYIYPTMTDSTYDNKTFFFYDEDGNQNKSISYNWDVINKHWNTYVKNEFAFNSDRKKILASAYNWADSSGEWIPWYKMEYGYDVYGYQNRVLNFDRDNQTNQLVPSYKNEFTYSASGKTLHTTTYIWNKDSEQWIGTYDYDYPSDSLFIGYAWDPVRNQWYNWHKTEINCDSSGYMNSEFGYEWDTTKNSWSVTFRDEATHDFLGNETSFEEYSWVNFTSSWIGIFKGEYTYDGNQNVISESDYMWDYEGSKWFPYLKRETEYNGKNIETGYIIYNWNDSSGLWHESEHTKYYFDSNGKETLLLWYNTNKTGEELQMQKEYFYYSDHTLANSIDKTEISNYPLIFPNPANDYVHIGISANQQGIANIFNISGQLLKSVNVCGTNNEIPVNSLSKGVYFIKIVVNDHLYIQKLLIK